MHRHALLFSAITFACALGDRTDRIDLTPGVLIAGVGDSVDLSRLCPRVSETGWIAAQRVEPPSDVIAIYDSDGKYVHTIGRAGGGPGEFRSVTAFGFGPGDSLWVIDSHLAASIFEPPPGTRFVRSFRFERFFSGEIVSLGMLSRPSYFGSPLRYVHPRVLSWDGTEVSRFTMPDSGSLSEPQMGPVALVGTDLLWIANERRYELLLLVNDGTVRRRITREADWFAEHSGPSGLPWVTPPKPTITSISVGPDSMLWVLVRRAHRNWEQNKSKAGQLNGLPTPRSVSAIKVGDLFEGVVDVLDPVSGQLLASHEVSGDVLGFIRPGVLCEVLEDDSGAVRIQLWDVRLRRGT